MPAIPPSDPAVLLVLTTAGSPEEAQRIARALVERRLAACVNVLPGVRSVYRWREAVEESDEVLLLAKTTEERFAAVRAAIRELHSYDLPDILAVPVSRGDAKSLAWLAACVAGEDGA